MVPKHLLTKESFGKIFPNFTLSDKIANSLGRIDGEGQGLALWFKVKISKWLGRNILSDSVIQQKIDDESKDILYNLCDENHDKIENAVYENIKEKSDEELVKLIEDKVGDELQYIRLNGEIVGSFAGLVFGIVRIFLA